MIFLNLKIRHIYLYLLVISLSSPSSPGEGNLPNPGTEPKSPTLQADSLPAEPQGSPRILEWVAYPFSRGSSWPGIQTGVSCIAGRFFTNWGMREAQLIFFLNLKLRHYIYLYINGNLSLSIPPPSLWAPPTLQFVRWTHITHNKLDFLRGKNGILQCWGADSGTSPALSLLTDSNALQSMSACLSGFSGYII